MSKIRLGLCTYICLYILAQKLRTGGGCGLEIPSFMRTYQLNDTIHELSIPRCNHMYSIYCLIYFEPNTEFSGMRLMIRSASLSSSSISASEVRSTLTDVNFSCGFSPACSLALNIVQRYSKMMRSVTYRSLLIIFRFYP